jgi:hypothetical protein
MNLTNTTGMSHLKNCVAHCSSFDVYLINTTNREFAALWFWSYLFSLTAAFYLSR